MDLNLDPTVGDRYSSLSQKARVITQDWAGKNFYCVACPSSSILLDPENTAVRDFACPNCESIYQLKAKAGSFGHTVNNSAYAPKIEAIETGRVPSYAFLQYSRSNWRVTDLFVYPDISLL
jgi:type II restriction enzyme